MRYAILILLACSTGCSLNEGSVCDGSLESPTLTPDQNTYSVPADATELKITGSLTANIRLDSLLIGGVRATGVTDNFRTWQATFPIALLNELRRAGPVTLKVVAHAACGKDLVVNDQIPVVLDAPTGTTADDLDISLKAFSSDATGKPIEECFLPADGRASARVVVSAASSSVGVPVRLGVGDKGELLGVSAAGDVVLRDTGGQVEATAAARAKVVADGALSVSASAGSAFKVSDALVVALAPKWSAEPASLALGQPGLVFVETAGRLASCETITTPDAEIELRTAGAAVPINGASHAFFGESCGQNAIFSITFHTAAAVGSAVVLRCTDTWGQTSTRVVSATAAPDDAEAGGSPP